MTSSRFAAFKRRGSGGASSTVSGSAVGPGSVVLSACIASFSQRCSPRESEETRRKRDSSTSRAPAILSTSYVNDSAGELQKLPQPENFLGCRYFLVDRFLVERHQPLR